MSKRPGYSPWGAIQSEHKLCDGVYNVSTASHGGIMVSEDVAESIFSGAALDCAFRHNWFYCFEEDCAAPVALRELLDKKLITGFFNLNAEELSEIVNRSLQAWQSEYLESRKKSSVLGQLQNAAREVKEQPSQAPSRNTEIKHKKEESL